MADIGVFVILAATTTLNCCHLKSLRLLFLATTWKRYGYSERVYFCGILSSRRNDGQYERTDDTAVPNYEEGTCYREKCCK